MKTSTKIKNVIAKSLVLVSMISFFGCHKDVVMPDSAGPKVTFASLKNETRAESTTNLIANPSWVYSSGTAGAGGGFSYASPTLTIVNNGNNVYQVVINSAVKLLTVGHYYGLTGSASLTSASINSTRSVTFTCGNASQTYGSTTCPNGNPQPINITFVYNPPVATDTNPLKITINALTGGITTGTDRITFTNLSIVDITSHNPVPMSNMFGVNGYEWDFIQNPNNYNDTYDIYQPKMNDIKGFTSFRHYIDWDKIEHTQGQYTFDPTNQGGWNYDNIYSTAKADSVLMLADLKNCPQWFLNSYPSALQNSQDVPAPYGSNLTDPASYILQAKAAFQLAARYGSNPNVDTSLVSVYSVPRWYMDWVNVKEVGLNELSYIECNNEPDHWWIGPQAQQTPEQYAANLSAFYDGNMGKLGKNVGVKNADPNMKVVMGGLAAPNASFVQGIINWCITNRGYKPDGSVNLCFDVINYHKYSNDGFTNWGQATVGMAPELSDLGSIADSFTALAATLKNKPEVWVTENGYDINSGSIQRAIPIGKKTALLTQADWSIRSCLLYARHGVNRLFFYQLFDAYPNNPVAYGTSGLINADFSRRPAADYMLQVRNMMGNYTYNGTISSDPLVDVYVSGSKTMYVLTIPDQKGRTGTYTLNLGSSTCAKIYSLTVGASLPTATTVKTTGGKLTVNVSETPVFVQGI
jgi:hypothetical protein